MCNIFLTMRGLLKISVIVVFIPLILQLYSASEIKNCKCTEPTSLEDVPFSLVTSAPDPFVLPNQSGGDPFQTDSQRLKLPVIEWKTPAATSLQLHYQSSFPFDFFPVKGFRVEPIFKTVRFLRL